MSVANTRPTPSQGDYRMLRKGFCEKVPMDLPIPTAEYRPGNNHSDQEGIFVFLGYNVLIPELEFSSRDYAARMSAN